MATENAQLLVQISASTELLRQQMIQAENAVEKSTRAMQRDLKNFDSKLTSVEKAGFKMGAGLRNAATSATSFIAAIGVGTLVTAVRNAVAFADSIGDVADQLGVSTDFLQQFRFAVQQSGGSVEGADNALGKFAVTTGKALNGNKAAANSFAALGITVADLAKANESQRFELVAEAISKIPDPARQAAAAYSIFGKGAREILPLLTQGAQGFRDLAAEGSRLGVVLSKDAIANADKTARKMDALTAALQVKFSAAVLDNSKSIDTLVESMVQLINFAGKSVSALKNFDAFLDRASGSDKYKVIGKLITGDYAGANQAILDIGSGATTKPGPAPKAGQSIVKPGTKSVPFFPGQGNAGDFAKTPRGPLKGGIGGAFGAFGAALTIDVGALLAEAAAVEQIGTKARSALPAVAGLTEELNKLGRAELERPAGVDFNGSSGADQVRALVDAADERFAAESEANQAIADDLKERMSNATQFAAFQFETLFRGGVGDVWDNFQRLGEQVIAQVAAKFLIALLSKDGLSSSGGLGGIITSTLGSIFGGGFANGGNPPVGKISMVGERGPELIMPRVPTSVVSNDNLAGIGGGSVKVHVEPSPYFTVRVEQLADGRIANATPGVIGLAKRETLRDVGRRRL